MVLKSVVMLYIFCNPIYIDCPLDISSQTGQKEVVATVDSKCNNNCCVIGSFVGLSSHQFLHPSVCLSVCLSVCPSVRPSVCLSVCLSVSQSVSQLLLESNITRNHCVGKSLTCFKGTRCYTGQFFLHLVLQFC